MLEWVIGSAVWLTGCADQVGNWASITPAAAEPARLRAVTGRNVIESKAKSMTAGAATLPLRAIQRKYPLFVL